MSEGGWFDPEAIEAEKMDADMEMADLEAAGREHRRRVRAAAFDLLEACKRIDAAPYGVALGDLEALRAAIAKAEGK